MATMLANLIEEQEEIVRKAEKHLTELRAMRDNASNGIFENVSFSVEKALRVGKISNNDESPLNSGWYERREAMIDKILATKN